MVAGVALLRSSEIAEEGHTRYTRERTVVHELEEEQSP
ncbi:hypothetical protein LXL04_039683 [Taraxacum kok-saghyz]